MKIVSMTWIGQRGKKSKKSGGMLEEDARMPEVWNHRGRSEFEKKRAAVK